MICHMRANCRNGFTSRLVFPPTASIEWSRTVDDHNTTSISNSSAGRSARALHASIADHHSRIPRIRSSEVGAGSIIS
jgi:hypothetical protein